MRAGLAILLALAGCDKLFQLDYIDPIDASPIDTTDALDALDAPPGCAGHNEDGDAFADMCDPCPIDRTGDHSDGDGDGIGTVCDLHPITGNDLVIFFSAFVDFTGWSPTAGATLESNEHVVLQGSGRIIRSFVMFDALRIPITLNGTTSPMDAFFVYLSDGSGSSFECRIHGGPCVSGQAASCMIINSTAGAPLEVAMATQLSDIGEVEIRQIPTGTECHLRWPDGMSLAKLDHAIMIEAGSITVQSNNSMRATLHSAILYAR